MKSPGFFLLAILLSGCSTGSLFHLPKMPKLTVTSPSGQVMTQTGDAAVPAHVSTVTTGSQVQVPAGSNMVFDQTLGTWSIKFGLPSTVTASTKVETVDGPKAFTPAAPPTPAAVETAKLVPWLWGGMILGIAVALFGLVRDWNFVMAGGGIVAASCAFGIFVEVHPVIFILIGVGLVLKVVGPYIWAKYGADAEALLSKGEVKLKTETSTVEAEVKKVV